MGKDLIPRYVWIVDTLRRYGPLSRERLSAMWTNSVPGNGTRLAERTFHHYRRAIEEVFNLTIACNTHGEYYIRESASEIDRSVSNLLVDNYALGDLLRDNQQLAGRVAVEEVPSAREYLAPVLEAMRQEVAILFTYAGFNRSRAERDILFHPYMVKRYKQRWYMLGRKVKSGDLRTYALDRIRTLTLTDHPYRMPDDFQPAQVFGSIVGVTSSHAPVREVRIRATSTQAKYWRALPLHPSQSEEVHDTYSVFTFRLRLNYELVSELLALGDSVRVLAPTELKVMVVTGLRSALSQYLE